MALTLTSEQQRLVDWARDSLPSWYCNSGVDSPELQVFAIQLHRALMVAQFWSDMSFLGRAVNDGEVDWLDGLARDLGTKRITGESDDSLRFRCRNIQPAIIPSAIRDAVNAYLAAVGVSGSVILEELPRDAAYCLTNPGTPSDASGFAFAWTPALDALSQRCSKGRGGTVVLVVPHATTEGQRQAIYQLALKLRAAGMQLTVEISGA